LERQDIYEGVSPTFEGRKTHIDYGWIDLAALEGVAGTFSFLSASDHRQLWGSARFR
jgi:hypothetical protein